MSTVPGAVVSILVLSAAGALPTVALARARLVVIPLAPLTGAVLASLAVTAMTAVGGSMIAWFVVLSLLGAVAVAAWWHRRPSSRPWHRDEDRAPARALCAGGLSLGVIAAAFGLSALKAPFVSYDARMIWMVHPAWYLAGRSVTVAALRNPALVFAHPPYPPLVGGAVAVGWFVSGLHTDRLGLVIVSLLGACAALAAASAIVEVARKLAASPEDRRRRTVVLGSGVLAMGLLTLLVFAVAQSDIVDGHADALWSAAAVGAVAYGLVLPCEAPNVGVAMILAAVAGTTKLEGSIVAAVIVGLIALRLLLQQRRVGESPPWLPVGVFAIGSWVVIGSWPLLTHLLDALPNRAAQGVRQGTDISRLSASVAKASSDLHGVGIAVVVAVLGAVFLRGTRRNAGLGSDAWAWGALLTEVGVVVGAYVVGPGDVHTWLRHSIGRTLTYPVLEAYWIMVVWGVVAVSKLCLATNATHARDAAIPEPLRTEAAGELPRSASSVASP